MNKQLAQRVLLNRYPGVRLALLTLFWTLLAGVTSFLMGYFLVTSFGTREKDGLILQKRIQPLGFLSGASGFSELEIKELELWPEIKRAAPVLTAKIPLFLQLKLKDVPWGTSLFVESVPDSWLDSGLDWPATTETIPLIIGKDFLDLYNWGFAPSQGMPPMSLVEAALIPLQLTVNINGKTQTYAAKIVGTSQKFQSILIPQNWMNKISETVKPAALRVLCDLQPGQFSAFNTKLNNRGWELTSAGANNPWRVLSENLILVILCILLLLMVLTAGWTLLFLKLWWNRLQERLKSLFELSCSFEFLVSCLGPAFRKTVGVCFFLGSVGIVFAVTFFWGSQARYLVILAFGEGLFLTFCLLFQLLYSQSLKKSLKEILNSF